MAESYISALSGDFDPTEFADHYREALEEVIEAKVAGREVKHPEEAPAATGQVVDLMEALRRSVAEAKARRGESTEEAPPAEAEKAPATKAAPKKSAAKKTSASKASATKSPAKKATAKKAAEKKPAAKKTTTKKAASRRSA